MNSIIPKVDRNSASSLVEFVYLSLRAKIVQAEYKPGQPLRAGAIAHELNVSMIPVREAIRRLEAEGLARIDPNRGARVTEMSRADLVDIYGTRKVLELEALRRSVAGFAEDDFTILQRYLDSMTAAYRKGDIETGLRWHRKFHLHLYSGAATSRIIELIEVLWTESDRYMWLSPHLLDRPDFHDEHEEILSALRLHDTQGALQALEAHHDLALSRVHDTIPDSDGEPSIA